MEDAVINNDVKEEELYDGKTWIHGITKDDIRITIFLITICSDQLKYSLEAINDIDTKYSVLVNVIMNVSPTNKAYNEMRLRCETDYFIQNDEDMELYSNSLDIISKWINKPRPNTFLYTFKLIDTCLGVGSPPIIDCLKLYNNKIMEKYPTYLSGNEAISSVDNLWHKNALKDGYSSKGTNYIIGYHGKHRNDFDLMLRYCKILKSILDPRIKTNRGHLCKLLGPLYAGNQSTTLTYFNEIISHFKTLVKVDYNKLNETIGLLNNSYIPQPYLDMYGIKNRSILTYFKDTSSEGSKFTTELLLNKAEINKDKYFCIVGILCVITDNYEYSLDKYPFDIYEYFNDLLDTE